MRISLKQLKQIIKEEVSNMNTFDAWLSTFAGQMDINVEDIQPENLEKGRMAYESGLSPKQFAQIVMQDDDDPDAGLPDHKDYGGIHSEKYHSAQRAYYRNKYAK